jgi:hypothetical protein
MPKFETRHGLTDTPVHRSWMSMWQRCTNPNDSAFKNYGGRGIAICERWAVFENFLADMGPKPDAYELERQDVNGNYEPGNCRWATIKEQANNRRTNRFITHEGRTQTLAQWAEELGIKMHTLYRRIAIKKVPIERALTANVATAAETSRMGAAARWAVNSLVAAGHLEEHGERVDVHTNKRQKLLRLPQGPQRELFTQ